MKHKKEERIIGDEKGKKHKKEKPEFKKAVPKYKIIDKQIAELELSYENINAEKVKLFTDLPLTEETLKGLQNSKYEKPTKIQKESIGLALRGLDILGAAKTGSGKTLAFVIPILERLYIKKWTSVDGIGALIITPTRELAYQIFEHIRVVGKFHDYSAGLVIGGTNLKVEWSRVSSCNIVVCTPGRILQHVDENPFFNMDNLQILVLDEADRCLDMGFKTAMNAIIASLPSTRQTLLFSATQTRSVTDLARLSLEKPVFVSVHENSSNSTPKNLQQSYCVVNLEDKMNMIWSFMRNHKKKKILIFLQSCKQVKYIDEIFKRLRSGLKHLALYGTMPQMRRMAVYDEFCAKEHCVLFATDIAARGLDFPAVDWVIQMDCPEDGVTYVHRAGRTARYNTSGESLLLLLPSEEAGMLKQLSIHKIPIEEIKINPKKLTLGLNTRMSSALAADYGMKESAQRAFQAYVKSIYLMKNKTIFNIDSLDLPKFAESLGLLIPPRIRFLDKQKKIREQQKQQSKKAAKAKVDSQPSDEEDFIPVDKESAEIKDTLNFLASDDEDGSDGEENDLFTVKRKNHAITTGGTDKDDSNSDTDSEENLATDGEKKIKVLTKAQIAKKLRNKQIVANTKIVFADDGDIAKGNSAIKSSAEGKEYEVDDKCEFGGLDIEKAKLVLRAEDEFDKEAEKKRKLEQIKEKKRKAMERLDEEAKRKKKDEEESDSEPEVDLSFLPDPDKIYNKKSENDNSDDNESSGSDSSDDNDDVTETIVKDKGASTTIIKKHIPKLNKDTTEDDGLMDIGLSVDDDEELALQLLRRS